MAKCVTNASFAIWWPNLELMQVMPSGGPICNQVAPSADHALLSLNLVQVTESVSGSVVPVAMFIFCQVLFCSSRWYSQDKGLQRSARVTNTYHTNTV